MRVQNLIATRAITANLASVSIATYRFPTLTRPILAIVDSLPGATSPVGIQGAASFLRHSCILALMGAKTTIAEFNLCFMNSVLFATVLAWFRDKVLGAAGARLRLNGRELVGTMLAAKTTLAIGVMVKLCFAPFTNEDGMLGGVAIDPAVRKPTSLGTETAPGVVLDKWSAALFTGLGSLLGFASALIAS